MYVCVVSVADDFDSFQMLHDAGGSTRFARNCGPNVNQYSTLGATGYDS